MRDYLNTVERHTHLFMIMVAEDAKDLIEKSEGFTDEEKKILNKIVKETDKLSESLFRRFGEPYKRKQLRTLTDNRITVVGKYAPSQQCISNCAQEDLIPLFSDLQVQRCWGCQKCKKATEYTECAVYAMGVAIDIEGTSRVGCPYSMEDF